MIRYQTSLRDRNLSETFAIANEIGRSLGVSRITCTTYLDQIGLPVYSSIRPRAKDGSLCVTSGKGMTIEEARVSACMEAIEMAMSEPENSDCKLIRASYREVLKASENPRELLDLSPKVQKEIPLDDSILCVEVNDLVSEEVYLVPAELVVVPDRFDHLLYGYHTNGLASGNSLEEACIHGILEVIERDILSFEFLRETSFLLPSESYLANYPWLEELDRNGIKTFFRTVPNIYGFPFVGCYLVDQQTRHPAYINSGFGLHPDFPIALSRALTEAAQSRLTFIQGVRDDMYEKTRQYDQMSGRSMEALFKNKVLNLEKLENHPPVIPRVSTLEPGNTNKIFLDRLLSRLKFLGVRRVLMARHTKVDDPLQVVRIIIPKMEFYNPESPRVGPRLHKYVEYVASGTICGTEFESEIKSNFI